jgi:hypothetical protein
MFFGFLLVLILFLSLFLLAALFSRLVGAPDGAALIVARRTIYFSFFTLSVALICSTEQPCRHECSSFILPYEFCIFFSEFMRPNNQILLI